MSTWIPGCADASTPVRLEGAPTLVKLQGLYGTDATGQMWTWIGAGRCSDGVASGAVKVIGPRDARISPWGTFFSADGKIWELGDEFDTFTPTPGQAPTLSDATNQLNAADFDGHRVLYIYKNGPALVTK